MNIVITIWLLFIYLFSIMFKMCGDMCLDMYCTIMEELITETIQCDVF